MNAVAARLGSSWGRTALAAAGIGLMLGGHLTSRAIPIREVGLCLALVASTLGLALFGISMSLAETVVRLASPLPSSLYPVAEMVTPADAELRLALARGEIIPFYQPIVDLQDERLLGFECLARWDHPVRGIRAPDTFIPLAEESGVIDEVTIALLDRACRDAAGWGETLSLSINVTPRQLCNDMLPERLLARLAAADFAPERLIVEVTETGRIEDIACAQSIVQTLRAAGVRVALDDFGVGYSSLLYLRSLNLDAMKIDKAFVHEIGVHQNLEIVRVMLALGQGLGLSITAEGIEHPLQMTTLLQLGCTHGQGFLFSPPVPTWRATEIAADPRSLFRGLLREAAA